MKLSLSNIHTMQDILGNAFRIPYNRPLLMHWGNGSKDPLILSNAPSLERCYYVMNGVVIFRTPEAAYVLPYAEHIEDILLERGYILKGMYVPFSDGKSFPLENSIQYHRLF